MCARLLNDWQLVSLSALAGVLLFPLLSWSGSTSLLAVTIAVRWLARATSSWRDDESDDGRSAS